MAEPNLAILGGRGMLGTDLARLCEERCLAHTVFDLPECDITREDHLRQALQNAAVVVNCAAYTNVDGAETEKDTAYKVNAEAVGTLGKLARQNGIPVLHISTDFVFDGSGDQPYTEEDRPNPINTYGASKLAGEQQLAESRADHCIIRVEWTYGQAGENFITKIVAAAKKRDTLRVVNNEIGSPTATSQVAETILQMLEKQARGLYHFANAGYASRFDVARFIVDRLRLNTPVEPCKSDEYPTPAKRPLNSRFDCRKIQVLLDKPIEHWQKPLERFLKTL
jgi:dTDP-4-dehydrorhamnose reductase